MELIMKCCQKHLLVFIQGESAKMETAEALKSQACCANVLSQSTIQCTFAHSRSLFMWLLINSLFITLFLFGSLSVQMSAAQPATSLEVADYLFVIDTSGSMVGKPTGSGNVNIMPQVKEAIKKFLSSLPVGARVVLLPFDRQIHSQKEVVIKKESDRGELKNYVDRLRAEGQVTWIYYALKEVVQKTKQLSESAVVPRKQIILVYTDGLNNGPDDFTLDDLIRLFKLHRGEEDFLLLHYITLGVGLPERDKQKLEATEGVKVNEEPKGEVTPIETVMQSAKTKESLPAESTPWWKHLLVILFSLLGLLLLILLLCLLLTPKFPPTAVLKALNSHELFYLKANQKFCRKSLTVGGANTNLPFEAFSGECFRLVAKRGEYCDIHSLVDGLSVQRGNVSLKVLRNHDESLENGDIIHVQDTKLVYES